MAGALPAVRGEGEEVSGRRRRRRSYGLATDPSMERQSTPSFWLDMACLIVVHLCSTYAPCFFNSLINGPGFCGGQPGGGGTRRGGGSTGQQHVANDFSPLCMISTLPAVSYSKIPSSKAALAYPA